MRLKIDEYYEIQKTNLNYPNEEYIHSEKNLNKADFYRFNEVFLRNNMLTGSMLDIGCNDGYLMRNFPWKFDKFLGIDMFSISEYTRGEFDRNKDKYTLGGMISYKTGLFEDMYIDDKFNFVFCGEILEHVLNPEKFIEKVKVNIGGGGGKMAMTTPNNIGKGHSEHLRQFSKTTLYSLLSKFFPIVLVEELPQINDSWPFLYAECTF